MKYLCGFFAATVVACMLLIGCGAERVAGVKSATTQGAAPTTIATGACHFSIKNIDDLREQTNLGKVGRTLVDGKGFNDWFENGLSNIPGYSRDDTPIELHIEILKAYVQSISTLKSANIIVRIHFMEKDNVLPAKIYRGVDGSVNWASSESEIQTAFDNALNDLKIQIGTDINKLCKH